MDIQNLLLVENAETNPLHFTLELEGLSDQGNSIQLGGQPHIFYTTLHTTQFQFFMIQSLDEFLGPSKFHGHGPWL
jgi:hypothetical protein